MRVVRHLTQRERDIQQRIFERVSAKRAERMLHANGVCGRYLDAATQCYGPERNGVRDVMYDEYTGWYRVTYVNQPTRNFHEQTLTDATAWMYAKAHEVELCHDIPENDK